MQVTPEEIKKLLSHEVFVFGSNESGIHGAGAARFAVESLGAEWGIGFGHIGQTFAIPTKDWDIKTLPLPVIEFYIKRFIAYTKAKDVNWLNFYVTRIGCGLAGYKAEQIAPFFAECLDQENIYLPPDFIDIIKSLETIQAE